MYNNQKYKESMNSIAHTRILEPLNVSNDNFGSNIVIPKTSKKMHGGYPKLKNFGSRSKAIANEYTDYKSHAKQARYQTLNKSLGNTRSQEVVRNDMATNPQPEWDLTQLNMSTERPSLLVKREKSKSNILKFQPNDGWSALQNFSQVLHKMKKEYDYSEKKRKMRIVKESLDDQIKQQKEYM